MGLGPVRMSLRVVCSCSFVVEAAVLLSNSSLSEGRKASDSRSLLNGAETGATRDVHGSRTELQGYRLGAGRRALLRPECIPVFGYHDGTVAQITVRKDSCAEERSCLCTHLHEACLYICRHTRP